MSHGGELRMHGLHAREDSTRSDSDAFIRIQISEHGSIETYQSTTHLHCTLLLRKPRPPL